MIPSLITHQLNNYNLDFCSDLHKLPSAYIYFYFEKKEPLNFNLKNAASGLRGSWFQPGLQVLVAGEVPGRLQITAEVPLSKVQNSLSSPSPSVPVRVCNNKESNLISTLWN